MTTSPQNLKKTALNEIHRALGARMVPFAGFDMPVQYSRGVVHEHNLVRSKVGLFDVSHMGILKLESPKALDFLNYALTRDLSKLSPGRAAYSLLCRENGGTVDDLIVYCEKPDTFYIVLNASNKEKDFAYLQEIAAKQNLASSLKWTPLFDSHGLIALQGPHSFELLKQCGVQLQSTPKAFDFLTQVQILNGIKVHLAFTGYTGEQGCEIFCTNDQLPALWNGLLEKGKSLGIEPIGLGARDTLRTEMGYSLYGHELSETINPIEAGLNWAVGLKKTQYVGKKAIDSALANPQRKIVSLRATQTKQAARPEMSVVDSKGQTVGQVCSGTFAPSLGYSIAMALVQHNSEGPYSIDIRGQKVPFELCERPFLKKLKS